MSSDPEFHKNTGGRAACAAASVRLRPFVFKGSRHAENKLFSWIYINGKKLNPQKEAMIDDDTSVLIPATNAMISS